ncbi:MAG: GAF domain-containing sensor histidine kinase, partial [Chloroflexi bacterium]
LTLLNQVIAASVSESDQQAILAAACRALGQAYSASVVCIVLLDFAANTATIAAEYQPPESGYPSILHQTVPARNQAVAQYFREYGKPLVLDNAQQNPRTEPFRHLLTQLNVERLVIAPLMVNDQFIGMLNVGNPLDVNLSDADTTLIARVADQLAGTLTRWQSDARRRLLSTAIEQASESILITDAEETILYVNPAFEQTTGYTREEAIGKTPRILNSHRQDKAFYADMWATINNGKVWHGRLVNRKKDGSLYTEDIAISPVTDKHNKIVNFVSVQRDVSRELQLEEQYYQSQKMESIGRLAGGVAHDFNNLLTGIMGFSELALQSLEPGTPARNDIQGVLKNAASAANLTRQLLAFARRQAIDPKILNLNEVVRNLNKMLRRLIGEHIVFETNLAPNLGQVKADPGQIEQVILNLAVNARDAMSNGGQLLIETTNITLTDKVNGQFADFEPGDYVLVAVSDTGAGMTEEVKARIFEPFFTTKEVGQGTGLGLATVFGIIKQAHGQILVSSQPGAGTTFNIYLPRVFAPPDTAPTDAAQASPWPRGTETILLVEDEESVRELSAYTLRNQGYTVLAASNGKEAIPLVRRHTGQIDLLLTDVVMPHMSGTTLAEKLKQAYPMLKILFTSGYADRVTFNQDMPGPDAAFLSKPFLPATLVLQVRTILDSEG